MSVIIHRESKLTRLLGAGLSGTRGEAVSMVVTLNPSPEYANETRHVLQLAAVAKDIRELSLNLSNLGQDATTTEREKTTYRDQLRRRPGSNIVALPRFSLHNRQVD